MASIKLVNTSDIHLMESDINDPFVHINLENLPNYSRQHIMQWLVYRGGGLQAIHSLKDAKTRVLRYFDEKTNDHLVDATLDLKWKRIKASCLGLTLSDDYTVADVSVPREPSFELGSVKSFNGWTKTLDGVPNSFIRTFCFISQ